MIRVQSIERVQKQSAVTAVAVFLVTISVAILSKPHYRVFFDFLSTLGYQNANAHWFNYGLLLVGLLLMAFFIASAFKHPHPWNWAGAFFGLTGSFGLIGIGLFPMTNRLYHFWATQLFFASMALAVLFFTAYLQKYRQEAFVTKAMALLVLVCSALFLFSQEPILENIAVLAFGIWLLGMAFEKKE